MNKFFRFEKSHVSEFMAKRADVTIENFLDEKEMQAINKAFRYGTLEYLSDGLTFLPEKNNATVMLVNLFIGNDTPKDLLKGLLSNIRTPFTIAVDFWCLSESPTRGLDIMYPSFGTSCNLSKNNFKKFENYKINIIITLLSDNKIKYMKWDKSVDELLESLDHSVVNLRKGIFDAHSSRRNNIIGSGVSVTKILAMWVRIQKSMY